MVKRTRFNWGAKVLLFIVATGFTLLLPVISFAQDLPCGGDSDDPFDQATCPLDTWVFVLAIIAVVFAFVHLYKKRSAQNRAA